MKKLTLIMGLLLFCSVAPTFAVNCSNCHRKIVGAANFCSWCGFSLSPAQKAFLPEFDKETKNKNFSNSQNEEVGSADSIMLGNYFYVSEMEMLLNKSNFASANYEAGKFRQQHDLLLRKVIPVYNSGSIYQRKMHDLHVKKFNFLNSYLAAWQASELGPDRIKGKAEKIRATFAITLMNKAIDVLLMGSGSLASIVKVEEIERQVLKNTQNFYVNSSYLLIGSQKLSRGEPIWIIEISGDLARVMHMGNGNSTMPICGNVSINDLQQRTNWRPDSTVFHLPPPTSAAIMPKSISLVKFIIVSDPNYPDWLSYRYDERNRGRHYRNSRKRFGQTRPSRGSTPKVVKRSHRRRAGDFTRGKNVPRRHSRR